jgi:hypothetical protein
VEYRKTNREVARKNVVFSLTVSMLILSGIAAFAREPAVNISPKLHPDFAAAQRRSSQAYNKIVAAKKADEWDMEGDALKPKELPDQVNNGLELAAEAGNLERGKQVLQKIKKTGSDILKNL